MMLFNITESICPCCQETRLEENLSHLNKWRKQHDIPSLGKDSYYKTDEEDKIRWACYICIKNNNVIVANPLKQDYSLYPYFVYFDIKRNCKTCSKEYTYTKEQQLFWYEKLGKNYWSRANNCLDCRIQKREANIESTRINNIISNRDENSIDSLCEVIDTYIELGNKDKALFYLSKLKKIAKDTDISIQSIKNKINNS